MHGGAPPLGFSSIPPRVFGPLAPLAHSDGSRSPCCGIPCRDFPASSENGALPRQDVPAEPLPPRAGDAGSGPARGEDEEAVAAPPWLCREGAGAVSVSPGYRTGAKPTPSAWGALVIFSGRMQTARR